jgi:hypothetical protein
MSRVEAQLAAAKNYLLAAHPTGTARKSERRAHDQATGYGLAAQKLEMMEKFVNYVAVDQVAQAAALAAALEEKLMSDAANKRALQELTNQYTQLAKQFEAMAKGRNPATNHPQGLAPQRMAQLPCAHSPTVDQGSNWWSHGFHVTPFHTSATCQTP